MHKIRQSGGFVDSFLGSILKKDLSLMKNVLKTLAKRFLATELAIDAAMKSLKDAGLLIKDVSETIENEAK